MNPRDFQFISKVILNQPYYYQLGYFLYKEGDNELLDYIERLLYLKIFIATNSKDTEKINKPLTLTPKWNGIKEGYIDDHGNWVIDPIFDIALPFDNGKAKVKVNNKWGSINLHGGWIERPGNNTLPTVSSKAVKIPSSSIGSGKKLRVTFPCGTVIEEPTAAATFVNTIVKIGADKVRKLGIKSMGMNIVSDSLNTNKRYSASQYAINSGKLYVSTYSGTAQKKKLLDKISDKLNLDLKVEKI